MGVMKEDDVVDESKVFVLHCVFSVGLRPLLSGFSQPCDEVMKHCCDCIEAKSTTHRNYPCRLMRLLWRLHLPTSAVSSVKRTLAPSRPRWRTKTTSQPSEQPLASNGCSRG